MACKAQTHATPERCPPAACAAGILQELYKQVAWPLYKLYGHAFEAFKQMVQDEGSAIIKRLEDERGALTVLTPAVSDVM